MENIDLSEEKVINLLKAYKWNELFQTTKNVQYNKNISINKQYLYAIKTMLTTSWWSDDNEARKMLKNYPLIIKEPIVYFAVMYSYISLADYKKIQIYKKNKPKILPKWMMSWLEIEFLGRSLKDEQQVNLAKKLTPINKFPENYIKIALLQSLEHKKANLTYLKKWLININLTEDKCNLSQALCTRVGLVDIDKIDASIFPPLLYRKANALLYDFRVIEAFKEYDLLSTTKFLDTYSLNRWLHLGISLPQAQCDYIKRCNYAMNISPNSLYIRGTIASYAMVHSWLMGNMKILFNVYAEFKEYSTIHTTKLIENSRIYFNYIYLLCVHWQFNKKLYEKTTSSQKIFYIFGESHSLSLSNISFLINDNVYYAKTSFVMGVKMYHLSEPSSSYHSTLLLEHFKFIKLNTDIMFTIGEIDTRPDEGIWQVHLKKEKKLDEIIDNTVGGYIEFLYENLKDKNLSSVTIQGIPAPNYSLEGDKDPKDKEGFLNMIKQVNEKLKELTLEKGWNFLDVYAATLGEDGKSNKKWHIDGYHLQPIFYTEAEKWLVRA